MKSAADVCRAHGRRVYWVDANGLVAVLDHRSRYLWYRWTPAGYSLCGETEALGPGVSYRIFDRGVTEHRL